jgi:hypothetical protein
LKHPTDRVEEPTMTVDLLRILLLEDEDDLDGDEIVGIVVMRKNERRCRVDAELGRVLYMRERASVSFLPLGPKRAKAETNLEDMSYGLSSIDLLLHDPVLVDSNGGENVEDLLVHRSHPISDEDDGDLLPSGRAASFDARRRGRLAPILGRAVVDDVSDVEHDVVKRSRIKLLVLVV